MGGAFGPPSVIMSIGANMKSGVRIALWCFLGLAAMGGAALGFLFATYDPQVVPGQYVGETELRGNRAAVRAQLAAWWSDFSNRKVKLSHKQLGDTPFETTLAKIGEEFNPQEFHPQYREFIPNLLGAYDRQPPTKTDLRPQFAGKPARLEEAKTYFAAHKPEIGPAKAYFKDGKVQLDYESTAIEFDSDMLATAVANAAWNGGSGEFPVKEGDKKVPDKELEKIRVVMSEFKTSFSAGNVSRSSNIRLAARLIDGTVLMPGETFSFNGYLGQRTTAKGFKVAGVYVSGRHDIDIGGGICQVSTTLYNASIRSALKIQERSPHSLPVPYVPLGQDAAVSYPNPDLKLTNPYDFPIALSATPETSTITFRILGAEKPQFTYKFESSLISSWSRGEKVVQDPSLAYGVRKVVDHGGSGRKVRTWRITYEGGKEVKREVLGDSTYSGGPRIVAVNTKARPAAPKTDAPEPVKPPPADAGN